MTDATTPEQPRTADWTDPAEVLADIQHGSLDAAQYIIEQLRERGWRIEAQARPAVAAEGLRAALEGLVGALTPVGVWGLPDAMLHLNRQVEQARAALASDAGRSVGALDVERLARALVTAGPNLKGWVHGTNLNSEDAAAIAAAYDAERQGESDAS